MANYHQFVASVIPKFYKPFPQSSFIFFRYNPRLWMKSFQLLFFKYHHNLISSLAIAYDVIMCIWSPHKSLTPLYVTKIIGFELCFRPILFLFVYLFLPFCPLFLDQRIFISVLSGIHLTFIPHPLSVQSSDSSLIIFLFLRKSESWTWHMYW